MMRSASVSRRTAETDVSLSIALDGTGKAEISTGVGFLDQHHTTEDTGIALGQALLQALGDKKGIGRYADIHLPMDETLTRLAVDISGRPFLVFRTTFPTEKIGAFDTELVREFFQAFAINAGLTLHVETLYGANSHHIAESCFKGLARALRRAVAVDPREEGRVPSTKGTL
jgi:imidazoleglycerol-phosphate dehydratase